MAKRVSDAKDTKQDENKPNSIHSYAKEIYNLYPPVARTWKGSPLISDIETILCRAVKQEIKKVTDYYAKLHMKRMQGG